jgi:hypothetical protein
MTHLTYIKSNNLTAPISPDKSDSSITLSDDENADDVEVVAEQLKRDQWLQRRAHTTFDGITQDDLPVDQVPYVLNSEGLTFESANISYDARVSSMHICRCYMCKGHIQSAPVTICRLQ